MTETDLEKVTNISMKDFRANTHFTLKDVLEKQPQVPNYEKALYISSDYRELFFVYNSVTKEQN